MSWIRKQKKSQLTKFKSEIFFRKLNDKKIIIKNP